MSSIMATSGVLFGGTDSSPTGWRLPVLLLSRCAFIYCGIADYEQIQSSWPNGPLRVPTSFLLYYAIDWVHYIPEANPTTLRTQNIS